MNLNNVLIIYMFHFDWHIPHRSSLFRKACQDWKIHLVIGYVLAFLSNLVPFLSTLVESRSVRTEMRQWRTHWRFLGYKLHHTHLYTPLWRPLDCRDSCNSNQWFLEEIHYRWCVDWWPPIFSFLRDIMSHRSNEDLHATHNTNKQ